MGLRTSICPFRDRRRRRTESGEGRCRTWRCWAGRTVEAKACRFAPVTRPSAVDAIFLGAGGNSVGAASLEAQWMRLAGLRQRPLPVARPVSNCWQPTLPPCCCALPTAATSVRLGQVLARPSACQAQRSRTLIDRWPAMDMRRPADGRRNRSAAERKMRLIVAALLIAVRQSTCCCRLLRCREAQAIDRVSPT